MLSEGKRDPSHEVQTGEGVDGEDGGIGDVDDLKVGAVGHVDDDEGRPQLEGPRRGARSRSSVGGRDGGGCGVPGMGGGLVVVVAVGLVSVLVVMAELFRWWWRPSTNNGSGPKSLEMP